MNSAQEGQKGRRGRSKRHDVLTAATDRFGRDGYEHTKGADIAADIGVGATALYHYFESKQHCLYVIMDEAIADSAAEMQAARLMTLHAAWVMDNHGSSAARTDVSMIKFFGAKVLHDVIDRAIQAHGSLGYSADLPLEAMYRYARAARIYDGPDEVHRQSVARMVLKGYRPPEDGVPSENVPRRRAAAREKLAGLID